MKNLIVLSKKELVKELKKINLLRFNLYKKFNYLNKIDVLTYRIEYFNLCDKLENWEKYYKLS